MKVEFINETNLIQETWLNENKRGEIITITKGDTFITGAWGYGGYESVLTKKGEWICDIDCKEFKDLFKIIG